MEKDTLYEEIKERRILDKDFRRRMDENIKPWKKQERLDRESERQAYIETLEYERYDYPAYKKSDETSWDEFRKVPF